MSTYTVGTCAVCGQLVVIEDGKARQHATRRRPGYTCRGWGQPPRGMLAPAS